MHSKIPHPQQHYQFNEHERAIHLYLNSNKKSAREIHEHFKLDGTNVPINTIQSWINRYNNEKQINNKPRGGYKRKNIITNDTKQKIIKIQNENNEFTLKQIQENITEQSISVQSISRILLENNYSTKQLYINTDEKNSDTTKAKRIEFMENTQDYLHESNTIFIDETPWNLGMKRKRGRSLKGVKAIKKQRVLKGSNITLIAAISPAHGLLHYETHESTTNEPGVRASRFNIFIRNLCDTPILKSNSFFLIVDNSNVHHRDDIEYILSINKQKNVQHHLIFLPPYSPMLTPIENIFYIWKQNAKQTRIEDKSQIFQHIYSDSTLITPQLCHDCYQKTLSFCSLIIDGADII